MKHLYLTIFALGLFGFFFGLDLLTRLGRPEGDAIGGDIAADKSVRTIAFIPGDGPDEYWQAVYQGCQKAADEFGYMIEWDTQPPLIDHQSQIDIVNRFVRQNISGVILGATRLPGQCDLVEKLHFKQIPCVAINTCTENSKVITTLAVDNYQAGVIAARRMGEVVKSNAKVIIAMESEESKPSIERGRGFAETIEKEWKKLELAATLSGENAETSLADSICKSVSDEKQIKAIFACDIEATSAAAEAVCSAGRSDIMIIGFGATEQLIEAVQRGTIESLIVRDRKKTGMLAVKVLDNKLNGKAVPKFIDTGMWLVTKKNLTDMGIKKLVNPD